MNAHTKPQKNNAKAASKFGAPTGVTTGPIIGSHKHASNTTAPTVAAIKVTSSTTARGMPVG